MRGAFQALLAAAIVLTIAGAVVLLFRASSPGGVEVVLPAATETPEIELRVHVKGAVHHPGVYTLRDGDRLEQAVQAAGGPTPDADLKVVNLARRVKDEDEWYIPSVGELEPPMAAAVMERPESNKIDINSATAAQLREGLPGIGDVRAETIVSYRETNGKFSNVDELLNVHGIGPKTLDGVRALIEAR